LPRGLKLCLRRGNLRLAQRTALRPNSVKYCCCIAAWAFTLHASGVRGAAMFEKPIITITSKPTATAGAVALVRGK
jgi:hypothetical protein